MARPMSEVECRAANGKIPENGIAILQISDFGVFEEHELYLVFFLFCTSAIFELGSRNLD